MKVYYKKDHHVIVSFGSGEMRKALGVLKGLARFFKADFILNAAEELERDLTPKLGLDNPYRVCEDCACEINLRKDSYLHQNERYTHFACPVLKERQK
jgi:hypothetical protein